ncbi:hypothetical protein OAZ06_00255 [Synechococcus sp. AH-736-G20]|nr:hypothetical protein [Synechococcus sp. AH-736-G20]
MNDLEEARLQAGEKHVLKMTLEEHLNYKEKKRREEKKIVRLK